MASTLLAVSWANLTLNSGKFLDEELDAYLVPEGAAAGAIAEAARKHCLVTVLLLLLLLSLAVALGIALVLVTLVLPTLLAAPDSYLIMIFFFVLLSVLFEARAVCLVLKAVSFVKRRPYWLI